MASVAAGFIIITFVLCNVRQKQIHATINSTNCMTFQSFSLMIRKHVTDNGFFLGVVVAFVYKFALRGICYIG